MSSVSIQSDHGELKRRLAELIGSNPDRYSASMGTERHRKLLDAEITRICEVLGLGFLAGESKQERQDAIMIKLGRDHRTGVYHWDSSDLVAVIEALEERRDASDLKD